MVGKQAKVNYGKIFENDFKRSIPNELLLYRLADSAQSFGGSSKLRFSSKNPFDYIMWDKSSRTLYALELKTVQGKSISFEREKGDSGKIHYHQICGLNEWSKYDVVCGFIIEYRDFEKTIFLEIHNFRELEQRISKKSFTLSDLDEYSIPYILIPQRKIRTRYKYDIMSLTNKINEIPSLE